MASVWSGGTWSLGWGLWRNFFCLSSASEILKRIRFSVNFRVGVKINLCVWFPLIIRVSLDPGDLALLLVLQHVEGEGVVPHHQVPAAVATATPGRISTGVRDFARALDISRCSKHMLKMSILMQVWWSGLSTPL